MTNLSLSVYHETIEEHEHFVFLKDARYEEGSIYDHLKGAKRWGGTPDFQACFDDLAGAIAHAKRMLEQGSIQCVITNGWFNVVHETSLKQLKQ